MKLISFAYAPAPIRAHTKTVTRRYNMWKDLKPGKHLLACAKARAVRVADRDELAVIHVTGVRFEPLRRMLDDLRYGRAEIRLEGFAGNPFFGTPERWVEWFCQTHRGCTPASIITRIEFKYVARPADLPASGIAGRTTARGTEEHRLLRKNNEMEWDNQATHSHK